MVKVPRKRKAYCPAKGCRRHSEHSVTKYTAGKESLHAQGKRRYDRKQAGFGGQTKPIFKNARIAKRKESKKIVLRLKCNRQGCGKMRQQLIQRCKSKPDIVATEKK